MNADQLNSENLFLEGMSDLQKEWLQDVSPPHLFAVISWGCAATAWLAKVLNSHRDIFCVHAGNSVWETFGKAAKLDGVDYMRILRVQGRHYAAAGDVHGVSRGQIARLKAAFPNMFNAAVLVREPIARLRSQLALFEKHFEHRFWEISYVDGIIEQLGLVLPNQEYRTKLFVHGASMLNAITEEAAGAKIFRQEDLTTRPESLKALMEELSAGKVSPALAWCQQALEIRAVNPHVTARQPFEFSVWQRDVLREVVNPAAWEFYRELGYPAPGFL